MKNTSLVINVRSQPSRHENSKQKNALILQGGYQPHRPKEVAEILAGLLREENFKVEISDTLDSLLDRDKLRQTDLIIPDWTWERSRKSN